MSDDALPTYPFTLERADIEALIPHRGDIFVCQRIEVQDKHHFQGVARWERTHNLLAGHFPGLPLVPGVMLIEAMAQLAGAGLLAGDPYVKTLPAGLVGVLAAVRRCVFSAPVLPEQDVVFAIACRQMGPLAVQVTAKAQVEATEVAQLEILMVYAERGKLQAPVAA